MSNPKMYSLEYVNFFVSLTAATSLWAGIVNPKMSTWLLWLAGFFALYWAIVMLRKWIGAHNRFP